MHSLRIRAVAAAFAIALAFADHPAVAVAAEAATATATATATIRIDPAAEAGAPISRRLFGKFTEHLGRNIYGGMWAQILRNPGFERPAFFGRRDRQRSGDGEGPALHWRAISDAPCTFRLTEDCALDGQTAQSIEPDAIGAKPAGIRQEGIDLPLHRESDYRLSLRVRGKGVEAGFTAAIFEGDRTLASAEFAAPAAAWEHREALLLIPRGSVAAGTPLAIEVRLRSPGRLDLDLVELFPCDADGGLDPDVIAFTRRARVALLRYPGGNFASGYHWRDGIGPRERRPIRRNEPWDMAEYNHMGTDEFLRFCEIAGCEPMICVNAGDGTAEEAAEWVAYANAPVTTPLGALRARNGHPAPYGVRYWEIGNEIYGDWQIGHTTAEGYAERYARFLAAMRAADPSIECVANGHDAAWNRTLLDRCGASVRSISVHPLIGGGVARDADPETVFRSLMAYPTLFEEETGRFLAWAKERGLSPRIGVTELQIFTNRPELPNNASLAEALWLGRFIHAAIRSAGAIECVTHSALVNHGGGLRKERALVYTNPVWAAQELYGTMSGVRPVKIEVECERFEARVPGIPSGGAAPVIDAVALRDGPGDELTLVAIQLDPRRSIEARIRVAGLPARAIRARRIEAPSYMARNTFAEPDAVRLREIPIPVREDGIAVLPPHSITEIVFRPADAPLWSAAWITDTQTPACEWITALIGRVASDRPRLVIHTGDTRFEWANRCAWLDVMDLLRIATPPIEFHLAPGNHDLTDGVLKLHLRRAAVEGVYRLDSGELAPGFGYYHDRVPRDALGPLWPIWNLEIADHPAWRTTANARPADHRLPVIPYRYVFRRGGIRFIVCDCYYTDEQRDWVRGLIAKPDESSVSIILHHRHEVDDLEAYVEGIEGQHNVKLVLSGDHHNYLREERHGVTFITAAGMAKGPEGENDAMTLWVYPDRLRLDRYVFGAGSPMGPMAGPTAIWTCEGAFSAYGRPAGPSAERLLTDRYTKEDLRTKLVPLDAWKPFPHAADRAAWEGLLAHPLGRARAAYLTGEAATIAGTPWPALPATLYMEYARNGNRGNFERPYFERRRRLAILVLAECFEHRGRFLDEIANGVWAISEESAWCLPAHASRPAGAALHSLDGETPDLFACETAMTLAMTRYLLRPELDGVCPVVCDRIAREVERRIIGRFLDLVAAKRAPGWTSGRNNWGPWCASNILGAAMLLVEDPARLAEIAYPLMAVGDRFIDGYGEDGGCDEGPSYWGEAGGALVILLELLHSRSGGAIDIYREPKIKAMGEFIARARIDGDWFANFADADAREAPHPGKVYRYGERVGSEAMRDLALLAMRGFRAGGPVDPPVRVNGVSRAILGPLAEIFWIPADAAPRDLPRELDAWYPDLQVLFARESTRAGEGLVLAAKGGHNAESHNHNDVGHFIVFLDGRPGIIDIGRETYTRQTFSDRRYELLFTRGLGHNAPVVNGVEQAPGLKRRATQVEFRRDAAGVRLSMHLEEAYPEEAGLASLRREIALERGADPCIRIRDTFEVREGPARILVPIFAAAKVERVAPGRLSIACGRRPLILEVEPQAMEVRIETMPIADPALREIWGEAIERIAFSLETPERSGTYGFRFRAGDRSDR